MTKKEIKQKIIDAEYNINGFDRLSGTDIEVKNIRVHKNKGASYPSEVIADVTLTSDIESGKFEVYKNVEYGKVIFMNI